LAAIYLSGTTTHVSYPYYPIGVVRAPSYGRSKKSGSTILPNQLKTNKTSISKYHLISKITRDMISNAEFHARISLVSQEKHRNRRRKTNHVFKIGLKFL
jgi:hypothetical protein